MLLEPSQYIAKMTGVLEVAGLRHIPIPGESLRLAVIIDAYKNQNPSTSETKKRALAVFKTLTDHTGASRLDELTTEKLNAYRAHIEATVNEPSSRVFYYNKIKSVIAFAMKVGIDPLQIRGALDRCRVLWTGEANSQVDPHPISREDWDKLRAASKGTPWEAWFLVALNLCLSIQEVCRLTWDTIDMEKGAFRTIRTKTKKERIPRAAVSGRRRSRS